MDERKLAILAGIFTAALGVSSVNHAAAVNPSGGDGPNTSLQDVLNNITTGPIAGVSSVDVNADQLSDAMDTLWSISASGNSVTNLIIELAGFANSNILGVYDGIDPTNQVTVFNGSDNQGTAVVMSILADGSVYRNFVDTGTTFAAGNNFGYFLDSTAGGGGGGIFYSDTALNADGLDHMVAYQGKNIDTVQIGPFARGIWTDNEYVLGWEDLTGGGDSDYQDLVVMVESVVPTHVPVPAAVWLFASGLLGLVGISRRKKA